MENRTLIFQTFSTKNKLFMLPPFSEANADNQQKPEANNSISKPLEFSSRIFSLDVLRGIAVLAALFVSIWMFGGFSTNKQNSLLFESKGV
jgi:hypothetical protein